MLMTTVTGIIVENTNTVLAAQKTLKVKNIKKPVRTVYLKMKPKSFLYQTMKQAMKAWNNTGAFTFKQVKRQRDANIIVTDIKRKDIPMPGIAFVKDDVLHIDRKASKLNPVINLNPSFLNKSYVRKQLKDSGIPADQTDLAFSRLTLAICEHELGHAIGLKHYKGAKPSVMKENPGVQIQPVDVQNVRKLYHLGQ
ncbi:zinc metalloprotease [Lactobacillus amylovorus]|uniref:hypothetical protein n=1 Tax=Lactobacillus amylovorus TaxID=1604 RepID=UPI00336533BC